MYNHLYEQCWINEVRACDDCPVTRGQGIVYVNLMFLVRNMCHLVFSLYMVTQVRHYANLHSSSNYLNYMVAVKGILYASTVTVMQIPLALAIGLRLTLGHPVESLRRTVIIMAPLIGFLNMLVFMLGRGVIDAFPYFVFFEQPSQSSESFPP